MLCGLAEWLLDNLHRHNSAGAAHHNGTFNVGEVWRKTLISGSNELSPSTHPIFDHFFVHFLWHDVDLIFVHFKSHSFLFCVNVIVCSRPPTNTNRSWDFSSLCHPSVHEHNEKLSHLIRPREIDYLWVLLLLCIPLFIFLFHIL